MVDKVWVEDDGERVVGWAGWAEQGSQGGQVGDEQRSETEGTFCRLITVFMTIMIIISLLRDDFFFNVHHRHHDHQYHYYKRIGIINIIDIILISTCARTRRESQRPR